MITVFNRKWPAKDLRYMVEWDGLDTPESHRYRAVVRNETTKETLFTGPWEKDAKQALAQARKYCQGQEKTTLFWWRARFRCGTHGKTEFFRSSADTWDGLYQDLQSQVKLSKFDHDCLYYIQSDDGTWTGRKKFYHPEVTRKV